MNPSPAVRRTLLGIAAVLLLGLAWTGLSGYLNQMSQSLTPGQGVQTVTQGLYGAFALLCVVTVFWGRGLRVWMQRGFVVTATLAAGLASVVWGDSSIGIGLVSGAAGLLVAMAIVWLLRKGLPA